MLNFLAFLAPVVGPILRFIYEIVKNYGLAIILFSLLIKLVTLPLAIKQQKSSMEMRKIQPELQIINKKYKNDKEKLQKETMKLYEKHNINPAAGCLPMLIQLPIIFALYRVIYQPVTYILNLSFDTIKQIVERLALNIDLSSGANALMTKEIEIANALTPDAIAKLSDILPHAIEPIDFTFLGLNLAQTPQLSVFNILWIIPLLAGVTTFLTSKFAAAAQPMPAGDNPAASMNNSMMIIFPFMTAYFCFIMPAGVGVYWIVNNVLSLLQQVFLNRMWQNKLEDDVIEVKKKKGGEPKK